MFRLASMLVIAHEHTSSCPTPKILVCHFFRLLVTATA